MNKDGILCFIAKRGGSSVPELMHAFSAPYREVREIVAKLENDELVKRDGGLEYKLTARGKSEAESIMNIDTIVKLVKDDGFVVPHLYGTRDYAAKWNGIAAEMHRTSSSDDDDAGEREDIIDAERTEKLLEELSEKSLAALEEEAKRASAPKRKTYGDVFNELIETVDYTPDFDDDDDEYGLDEKLLAEFDDDDDDDETDGDGEEPRSVFDVFFGSDDDDDGDGDGDTDGDK